MEPKKENDKLYFMTFFLSKRKYGKYHHKDAQIYDQQHGPPKCLCSLLAEQSFYPKPNSHLTTF